MQLLHQLQISLWKAWDYSNRNKLLTGGTVFPPFFYDFK